MALVATCRILVPQADDNAEAMNDAVKASSASTPLSTILPETHMNLSSVSLRNILSDVSLDDDIMSSDEEPANDPKAGELSDMDFTREFDW